MHILTSFECMFRASDLGTAVKPEADKRRATGEGRWLCDAAAARGTGSNETRREGEALEKIEANTLAVGDALECNRGIERERVEPWRGRVGNWCSRSGSRSVLRR